jgi:hypothetical protein
MTRRTLILAAFQNKELDLCSREEWCAADGSAFPDSSWRTPEGTLAAVGGLEVFQDIRTRRSFGDFEFHFEFTLAPGGNSGVKYLIDKSDAFRGHIRARGREFQLIDDASPAADRPDHKCGALYNVAGPERAAVFTPGKAASGKLVRVRSFVEHWINGTPLLRYALSEAEAARPTAIALQNHKSDIEFRRLRLLSL